MSRTKARRHKGFLLFTSYQSPVTSHILSILDILDTRVQNRVHCYSPVTSHQSRSFHFGHHPASFWTPLCRMLSGVALSLRERNPVMTEHNPPFRIPHQSTVLHYNNHHFGLVPGLPCGQHSQTGNRPHSDTLDSPRA